MNRAFTLVTFDCYGTLIDWESGIASAFAAHAARCGVPCDRAAVLAAYARHEPQVEAESFRPYRDVLAETARRVCADLAWPCEDATFLAESLPAWQPFADTNAALERLARAGLQLGILSNVDDDLLAATRRHFPVEFEVIVTAQQVRSYKPAPGHWDEALRRRGGDTHGWLHAAQSYFHDVEPCVARGLPVAWVNRGGETAPRAARPLVEVPTLAALADWLGA